VRGEAVRAARWLVVLALCLLGACTAPVRAPQKPPTAATVPSRLPAVYALFCDSAASYVLRQQMADVASGQPGRGAAASASVHKRYADNPALIARIDAVVLAQLTTATGDLLDKYEMSPEKLVAAYEPRIVKACRA
jgi:hypothetical protein